LAVGDWVSFIEDTDHQTKKQLAYRVRKVAALTTWLARLAQRPNAGLGCRRARKGSTLWKCLSLAHTPAQ
jgi:hypothetical protein